MELNRDEQESKRSGVRRTTKEGLNRDTTGVEEERQYIEWFFERQLSSVGVDHANENGNQVQEIFVVRTGICTNIHPHQWVLV